MHVSREPRTPLTRPLPQGERSPTGIARLEHFLSPAAAGEDKGEGRGRFHGYSSLPLNEYEYGEGRALRTNWESIPDADRAARVRYWTESVERARRLLDEMARYPVKECGEGFAYIPDAAAEAKVEMMFSTTKQAGKCERLFFVRRGIINDLIRAAVDVHFPLTPPKMLPPLIEAAMKRIQP